MTILFVFFVCTGLSFWLLSLVRIKKKKKLKPSLIEAVCVICMNTRESH